MLFNSLQFAVFFPAVTALYFALPHRLRWVLLLAASCVFYMAFIPAYVLILVITILIDYAAAIWIEGAEGTARRRYLLYSIVSTCLVLAVFKYFNFLNTNVGAAARWIGWQYPIGVVHIILPIGLSFHTFQSLSYVIEVYRGRQKAERHLGIYALYVMFYPQLVAGPIERPQNLLWQFREKHQLRYDNLVEGLKQMTIGFFKKLVIADRLAILVNSVYADPTRHGGGTLLLATVAFAYQIYCDFSGYSDIAIGAARVMGFRLMQNFDRPYAARSVAEFWQRWHISLSTWFRDYLYIPMGGNRVNRVRWCLNVMVTFVVSGLWHGANWTYVAWGALNGLYLVGGRLLAPWGRRCRLALGFRDDHPLVACIQTGVTFGLILLAWTVFRSRTLADAGYVIGHLWDLSNLSLSAVDGFRAGDLLIAVVGILVLEAGQYVAARGWMGVYLPRLPIGIRWVLYYSLISAIIWLGIFRSHEFIYFQF